MSCQAGRVKTAPERSHYRHLNFTLLHNTTLPHVIVFNFDFHVTGSFRKVSQAARSLCPTTLEKINSSVIHLVDTHPVLVLQWCHVLRQLQYTDTRFWYQLLQSSRSVGATGGYF